MAADVSMSILIVDDYNTMIRNIRNLLKQLGFDNVDDANDGTAALAKMREKQYALVISDWQMEPMTGYDLLREIRADETLRQTPFIIVTADTQLDRLIAARHAGLDECLVKPFSAAALSDKINGTVTRH
jgi:two-component system chemotaxis response regulator CheY